MSSTNSIVSSDFGDAIIGSSSVLFISAPKAGKTSLIYAITEQSDPRDDEIPEVLPVTSFQMPIASHDGATANILLEVSDSKSFSNASSEEILLKNIENTIKIYATDIVVLLVDATNDQNNNINIIRSTLKAVRQLELQLFIILTKKDLVDGDIVFPEDLVPELLNYPYFRGSASFGLFSSSISNNLKNEIAYDMEMSDFHYQLVKITYQLTNIVFHSVKDLLELNGDLTVKFKKILRRIFWVLQNDNKCGYLDEEQINKMKSFILGPEEENEIPSELNPTLVDQIFDEVMEETDLTDSKIFTLNSLENLMKKLTSVREVHVIWSFIFMFGYNEEMEFDEEFAESTVQDIPYGKVIRISPKGEAMLMKAFNHFDQNKDGLLSITQLKDVFEFAESSPFPENLDGVCRLIENQESGEKFIPFSSWLCLWNIVVLRDAIQLARHLLIWGFKDEEVYDRETDESVYEASSTLVSGERSPDCKTFIVYIFGASRSGKTALRTSLVGKPFDSHFEIDFPYSAFSTEFENKESIVILRECDSQILEYQEQMSICDAALLIFDGSDRYSFSVLPTIHRRLDKSIPAMYIHTHSESEDVEQEYEETPKSFWEALGLPSTPTYFSATHDSDSELQEIRETILYICNEPDVGQIKVMEDDDGDSEDLDEREIQRQESRKFVSKVLKITIGFATLSAIGIISYRFFTRASSKRT